MTRNPDDSTHDRNHDHDDSPFDPSEPLFPRQYPGFDPDLDSDSDFELDPEFMPDREPEPYPQSDGRGGEVDDGSPPDNGRHWHPDYPGWGKSGLINIHEASRLSKIGVSTLYRWVRTGQLNQSVISRNPLRFDWDELTDELHDRHWRV